MKVGLYLTNQHHLTTDMVIALDEQISMVHHIRDYGWDSVFSGQHYLNEGNNQALQVVPFLARLIPEAGDLTIGLGILLLNLHNPVYTAETIATLDIIAKGRLVFGVGLGYRAVEFNAFAVPKGVRAKRFEEYLTLIRKLWTEDSVTHNGETCSLDNVRMNLRPVQEPYPPIWIAANNEAAIKRAARMSDAWMLNPHSTIKTIRRHMRIYRAALEAAGKNFPSELPILKEVYCAKDRTSALEKAGPFLQGKYHDYRRWGQDKVMPDNENFAKTLSNLARDRFILGSPDDCYDQLRPYWEEFGINHLLIRTHWAGMPAELSFESMELLSKELLPRLRAI
ncbi:MAG: LLM class flavin-dependent oxidoreductase [Acidiferrobacteraceae bacterium]|nr:LLM class flavin-dependent oxidoreductase [Acidiferrobacteraceae bacterium]|tara:strand:- start:109 stop:1122 length:1014 start_codon:yes stop_codon:yes gene_type:complete